MPEPAKWDGLKELQRYHEWRKEQETRRAREAEEAEEVEKLRRAKGLELLKWKTVE